MRHGLATGAVLAAACASLVLAQDAPKKPTYDVKSEVCLKGKVADVRAIPDWMGHEGVNVTLETQPTQLVHVDVAPSSFLKAMDFPIAPGDDLEVTGTYGRDDRVPGASAQEAARHDLRPRPRGRPGLVSRAAHGQEAIRRGVPSGPAP